MRSDRLAAILLLVAAALGLALANSPLGPALLAAQATHLAIPGTPVDLTAGHWISDGLLAVFFFLAAVELKHELVAGELNTPARALRPAAAALGGVLVPAGLYLLITAGSGYSRGWPIPTATDIAFALGILAVFGRALPPRIRSFLLALAVIDDLIAIVIIAIFFAHDIQPFMLLAGAVGVAVFAILSLQTPHRMRWLVIAGMIATALITWFCVLLSGVHPTVAGVALGLAMARGPAARARHALEPWSNTIVLPLFAFSAALVLLPTVGVAGLAAPFWAILVALPVGKLVGITVGAWVVGGRERPALGDIVAIAAAGGVGFTVSLLMNELAFARAPEVADEGTLAVLLGSGIAMVLAAILIARRNRLHA